MTLVGAILVVTGVLALAITVRRTRVLQNRDIAIALSTLMLTTLLLSLYTVLRDETNARGVEDIVLTSIPMLVLLLGMMLLRASTRQDTLLRTSSKMWNALLEQATDAVLALDDSLRITSVNPSARALFERMPEDLAGKRLDELFSTPLTTWPELLEQWKAHMEQGKLQQSPEMLLASAGGKELWLAASLLPIQEGEKATQALLMLRDVTQFKEYERKRAEVDARGEMLLLLSHELRTPLTVIRGYAELLGSAQQQHQQLPQQGRYVASISAQATRLVEFVENILRTEAAGDARPREQVDLVRFLEEVVERFSVSAQNHRISMESVRSAIHVEIDTGLIEHALHNLLSNAVKYSPPGSAVRLRVELEYGYAWVSVSDEGRGIPVEELERVFERCYRAANSGEVSGLGLGLYLARRAVEEHGGSIWAQRVPKGSTFTFTLPVVSATLPSPADHEKVLQSSRT